MIIAGTEYTQEPIVNILSQAIPCSEQVGRKDQDIMIVPVLDIPPMMTDSQNWMQEILSLTQPNELPLSIHHGPNIDMTKDDVPSANQTESISSPRSILTMHGSAGGPDLDGGASERSSPSLSLACLTPLDTPGPPAPQLYIPSGYASRSRRRSRTGSITSLASLPGMGMGMGVTSGARMASLFGRSPIEAAFDKKRKTSSASSSASTTASIEGWDFACCGLDVSELSVERTITFAHERSAAAAAGRSPTHALLAPFYI